MSALFQIYDDLDPATEAALRSSIRRWGVIYPIVVDQHGHIIDGHHRQRIANELGLKPKTEVRRVRNEDEARELARTLNEDRRHDPEQRRLIVADLATEVDDHGVGVHSPEAIAGALGVSRKAVRDDMTQLGPEAKLPSHRRGRDGKVRPSTRSATTPKIAPAAVRDSAPTPPAGDQLGEAMAQAIENEPTVARSFAQTDLHRALSAVVKLRANYQDPAAAADLVPDDEREDEAVAADAAIDWLDTFRRRLRHSHLRVVNGGGL